MNVRIASCGVTGGNVKKTRTKIAPAINSTRGYCLETLLLQFLHAPRIKKKLNIGTRSRQVSFVPQDMHFDLPPIPTPVLNLRETTFKKLPITAPKTNVMIRIGMEIMSFLDQ